MSYPNLFSVPKVEGIRQSVNFAIDPISFLESNHEIHGDIFETKLGVRNVCIIRDSEAIHKILLNKESKFELSSATLLLDYFLGKGLLTTEGEEWKSQRKRYLKHFANKKVSAGFQHYALNIESTIDAWPMNQPFPLLKKVKEISIRVIIDFIFGTEPSQNAIDRIQIGTDAVMKFINLSRNPFYMRKYAAEIKKDMEEKVGLIDEAIEELMLKADTELVKEIREQGKTTKQIRDEITTLIAAGYESSMNAISSSLYFIEKHPHVKQKILEELSNHFLDSRDIFKLPYLLSVIQETMRLLPPGWMFFRKTNQDVTFQNYLIAKDTDIMINVFGLHRHPELWENAEEFKPERFARGTQQPENAYIPFGSGAKFCIGRNLALQEILFTIAYLYQNYDFSISNLQELKIQPEITLGLGEPFEAEMVRRRKRL